MPTYEYECEKCGNKFEIFQNIKEHPIEKCPECKGKVYRLIGAGAGIIFKGSGFYATDYRSESYKRAAKNDKESDKTSISSEEKSSNNKKEKSD